MKKQTGIWRRIFSSRWLLLFEVAVIVLFSVALTKEIIRRWEVKREIDKLGSEVETLKARKAELSGLIAYFQSDYFKEREARLKLGLQREGESALNIPQVQTNQNETGTDDADDASAQDTRLPSKWWKYFFAKR
ncbi:MAG: septum formation initiator family protein [Patescibacteria group bacterium]|nr:septum formation initiator family protein [Patescibacteria group bacterium]